MSKLSVLYNRLRILLAFYLIRLFLIKMSNKSSKKPELNNADETSSSSSSEESNYHSNNEGPSTSKPNEEGEEMSDESSSSISRITSAIVPREEFRSDLPALRALLNSPPSLPHSERVASSLSEYSTTSTTVQDYDETLSSAEAATQEKELSFTNRIRNIQNDVPGTSSGTRHDQPQNFTNVCTKVPKRITQRRHQTQFETGDNGHSRDSMEDDEGISSDSDTVNVIFEPFNTERGIQTVEPFTPSDTSSNGNRSPMKPIGTGRLNPSGPSSLQLLSSLSSTGETGKGAFVPVSKRDGKGGDDSSSSSGPPSPPPISPPPYPEEANQEMLKISPNTMADRRRKLSPPDGPSTVGKRTKKNGDEEDEKSEMAEDDDENMENKISEDEVPVPAAFMVVAEESSSCASSGSRNEETGDSTRPEVGSIHRGSELDSDLEDLPDEGKESDQ